MIFLNLGLILIGIGILGIITGLTYDNAVFGIAWLVSCTLFIIGTVITLCWAIDGEINPTAMDVYQGKTTLEITYKDGIPVDSVVVFNERK